VHSPTAVLFDNDGLLLDTESAWSRAEQELFERWLEAGHHGSMAWMQDPRRRRIEQLLPGVRSLLAVVLGLILRGRATKPLFPGTREALRREAQRLS
jgi:beta-phosphoglucomutase-like phosphatase (HAD superfamily)